MQTQTQNQLIYFVSGMWCTTCAKSVREVAIGVEGVEEADLNYSSKLLLITYQGNEVEAIDSMIRSKIERVGFGAKRQLQGWVQTFEGDLESEMNNRLSWIRISLVWFLAMWSSMIAFVAYLGGDLSPAELYKLALFTSIFGLPAILIGIAPYASSGVRALRYGRILTLDLFIFLGGISASCASLLALFSHRPISYADSGSMIVAILLLTKKIENVAVQKVTSSILFQIHPSGGKIDVLKKLLWKKAETSQIRRNDRIRIQAGETVAFDGLVLGSGATLNNHLLNGESTNVFLMEGDHVLAGAIAQSSFEMSVVNPQGYRKIDAWAEVALLAHNRNSRYAKLFSQVETGLTVTAFGGAVLIAATSWAHGESLFSIVESFFVGILIFCPCLFASIIPLTRQMAHLALSRRGVSLSRSEALLELCRVQNFYLDKTGTLEAVESRYEAILDDPAIGAYLLELASKSHHPILRGLARPNDAQGHVLREVEEIPGLGVRALTASGSLLLVGSSAFISAQGVPLAKTISPFFPVVVLDGRVLGQILVKSIYDEQAKEFLGRLATLYPAADISILSGDPTPGAGKNFRDSERLRFYGNLSPEEKVAMLKPNSAFVGDGLNDTLVLAKADVSFRVGNRVLGFAPVDFQLQSPDIKLVLTVIAYAKKYKSILIQTAGAALIYNICALGLAVNGKFSPLGAVLAMFFSFTTLLLSSLRLMHIPKEIL